MRALTVAIASLLSVCIIAHADDLAGLPVHPREAPRPEAIVIIGDGRQLTRSYAVLPDGTFEEWRTGVFRPQFAYDWSADRKALVVNSGPPASPLVTYSGPSWVFTPNACFTSPDGARLSADGKRVWTMDKQELHAYDTATGELRLTLPTPEWHNLYDYQSPVDYGPEFSLLLGRQGPFKVLSWLLADETRQVWVKTIVAAGDNGMSGGRHDYPGQYNSRGVYGLWKGPTGAAVLIEFVAAGDNVCLSRIHFLTATRFQSWTADAQPLSPGLMVSGHWPLDPATDTTSTDVRRYDDSGTRVGAGSVFMASRFRARWNVDGTRALLLGDPRSGQVGVLPVQALVAENGAVTVLPRGYQFVDFTLDGESLLAVISRQVVDPNADPKQQMLAKIDLETNKITWTSQPFANCRGMVPYPAFDLEEFHGGQ